MHVRWSSIAKRAWPPASNSGKSGRPGRSGNGAIRPVPGNGDPALNKLSHNVLVQRELENWPSPLASIPPCSADQLGEHRATKVATGELGGGFRVGHFLKSRYIANNAGSV
jgi:hypothetical protein